MKRKQFELKIMNFKVVKVLRPTNHEAWNDFITFKK